ncbi:hypothetical protein [Streptomyces sp. NPDC008150]|uniref:hypothetical protein n=1 Tax=Streptomyces sp. NPDC008150 TaxID=3364816 RepID=UPI0036E624C1
MGAGVLTRQSVRGATALRGGRSWRPTPYQVLGFAFWLLMSLAWFRVPLCCDAGQHAAVVERLRASLLHPRHPMADLPGAGSPYYSPYAVAEGAFARWTGLSGWDVVRLAGPVNLVVLLTGVGRFTRALTTRAWAPVLALAAMTLLWGTERAWWSGYLGLMSMTGNLGYPSTFAIGLSFWAWAWTLALARDGAPVRFVGPRGMRGLTSYAALGLLYALVLLVHPITAVASALGAVACVAGEQRWGSRIRPPRERARRRRGLLLRWSLTAAVAGCAAAAWPYFDVLALAGDDSVDALHRRLYLDLGGHFWLALIGLPALWLRARRAGARPGADARGGVRAAARSARDPLVLMFALDCLAVAYGWFSGHYTYGRILGLTLVAPQFALAVELARPSPWRRGLRLLGTAAAAGACLGLLTVQAGAVVPRSLDPVGLDQPPRWPSYAWAAQHLRRGDVVITDGYYAVHTVAGYGANLAAPAWPDASLDETVRRERLADVRTYLAPTTDRARRTAIAHRYHVRWLLLTRWHPVPAEAVVVAWSARTGEVLARVAG